VSEVGFVKLFLVFVFFMEEFEEKEVDLVIDEMFLLNVIRMFLRRSNFNISFEADQTIAMNE